MDGSLEEIHLVRHAIVAHCHVEPFARCACALKLRVQQQFKFLDLMNRMDLHNGVRDLESFRFGDSKNSPKYGPR